MLEEPGPGYPEPLNSSLYADNQDKTIEVPYDMMLTSLGTDSDLKDEKEDNLLGIINKAAWVRSSQTCILLLFVNF